MTTTSARSPGTPAATEEPAGQGAPPQQGTAAGTDEELLVSVDQDLCTGDGLCVTYAPSVFEFDIDGLAYVKGADGEMRTEAGAQVAVPRNLLVEVVDSAVGCPGECIHVRRARDGAPVAGPEAPEQPPS